MDLLMTAETSSYPSGLPLIDPYVGTGYIFISISKYIHIKYVDIYKHMIAHASQNHFRSTQFNKLKLSQRKKKTKPNNADLLLQALEDMNGKYPGIAQYKNCCSFLFVFFFPPPHPPPFWGVCFVVAGLQLIQVKIHDFNTLLIH